MKTLSEYFGQGFEIVSVSFFKSNFDMTAKGESLFSLRSGDCWGNKYEISGFDKTWEIIKPSVWGSSFTIREKNSELEIASLKASAFKNNCVINLPRGEKLNVIINMWKSTFELQNELGTVLVSFKSKKWYSMDVIATLQNKSETLDKYPFVILLTFLIVILKRHSAAAAA